MRRLLVQTPTPDTALPALYAIATVLYKRAGGVDFNDLTGDFNNVTAAVNRAAPSTEQTAELNPLRELILNGSKETLARYVTVTNRWIGYHVLSPEGIPQEVDRPAQLYHDATDFSLSSGSSSARDSATNASSIAAGGNLAEGAAGLLAMLQLPPAEGNEDADAIPQEP